MAHTILIIDDEPAIASTLAAILERSGYVPVTAANAAEALMLLPHIEPALVLSDVIMPGMNGIEMATVMRSMRPHLPLVLMSGNANTQDILEAARARGHDFEVFAKPMPPRDLLDHIARLLPPVARAASA